MDESKRLDSLEQQIRSDNEFYCLMMGSLAQDMKAGFQEMKSGMQEMRAGLAVMRTGLADLTVKLDSHIGRMDWHIANQDERIRQIEGRQRLQEQRFTVVLGAVPTRDEFQALEKRVQTLEDRAS